MSTVVTIIIAAVLTNNFVLSKFYGICPFLGVSKKLDSSLGMGMAVIFVMVCGALLPIPPEPESDCRRKPVPVLPCLPCCVLSLSLSLDSHS